MNFDIKDFKNTLRRECKELFQKIIEELADENKKTNIIEIDQSQI